MSRRPRWPVLLGWLLLPLSVSAEEAVDGEMNALRSGYEYGRYADVLERATGRIDQGRLSEPELVELHKLAGLSAFHLHRTEDAGRHFRALLRLDPDFILDPFSVPPPAVEFMDALREQMAAELDLARQEKRLRLERERVTAEEQRRRVELLARQVTVRRVEKRGMLVNFVPFGAGQFQQGRTGLGTVFAASEGVLVVTSLISFFAYGSLVETSKVTVDDIRGQPREVSFRYIPTERRLQARNWEQLQLGAAIGFYAVYAAGVVDALVHHQDEVVETSIETLPEPPAAPRARLHLFPTAGGAGAGFSLAF
ncbi:hypothetical protein [Archangium primigenium]|uniref:hypothetical protein n=1 Tax=[Archangium] primigenium TaxID=2792470 RepID=UPI00195EFBA3|nr:hypothetical protein [Archangium primigenium]MBM7115956.1 hypothetical protein [Archangium primigenium]